MNILTKCFKVNSVYCQEGYYKPFVCCGIALGSAVGGIVALCFNPYIAIPFAVLSVISATGTIKSIEVPPSLKVVHEYVRMSEEPSEPPANEVYIEMVPPALIFSQMNVNKPSTPIEDRHDRGMKMSL